MKPIAQILESVVEHLVDQRQSSTSSLTVLANWETLAPPVWSEHGRPIRLEDGELVVALPDGATASLLRFRVGELMDAINGALETAAVTTVRVITERTR
ncbi:MAG: DUF721 domain-containing protein [Acidimicrobiia bacterium]|nr:DUF721 domain-containing protein [Acidimicrobiia bacterium]NNC44089.1 DUF721 domain-containing protein [Acidimicrobiia bacterium]NNL28944.1 DUF721 domain-containing protein [Acidimicrobiia bacterium]